MVCVASSLRWRHVVLQTHSYQKALIIFNCTILAKSFIQIVDTLGVRYQKNNQNTTWAPISPISVDFHLELQIVIALY